MSRHWWRVGIQKEEKLLGQGSQGWQWKIIVNGIGAVSTAVVTVIFAVTKFTDGAWIIVLLLPTVVFGFFTIHRHYQSLAHDLSLDNFGEPPPAIRHRVIIPVSGIHRGTLEALDYASSISNDITAVHILLDPEERKAVENKWLAWGKGVRLVIIESPYRTFLEPFLGYVDELCSATQPNERLTIVVPQFNPRRAWHNILHTQTALWLRLALLSKKGIVITEVPYQVH
jgi:hypothetical protein